MKKPTYIFDTERYFYNVLAYENDLKIDKITEEIMAPKHESLASVKISFLYKTDRDVVAILGADAGGMGVVYSKLEEKLRRFVPIVALHFLSFYGLSFEAIRIGDDPVVVVTTKNVTALKEVLDTFHIISCKYEGRDLNLNKTYLFEISAIPGLEVIMKHYFKAVPRFLLDNLYLSFHLYTVKN